MKEKKKLTKKLALCGIFAALAIVLLYLGGLTPLDLCAIFICALITVLVVIEAGERLAWVYAAVTTTLALILLPNKLYAIEYAAFAAVYPIVKGYMEKLPKWWAWVAKIATLDLMLLGCVSLGQFVFNMGEEFFSLSVLTMVAGTLFFILFDFTVTKCLSYYIVILRKKLRIK